MAELKPAESGLTMDDYISREAAIVQKCDCEAYDPKTGMIFECDAVPVERINAIPAADVVPWEWLERYADYFCAGVSMPEFVREAKMFYEGTNEAMKEGVIDG